MGLLKEINYFVTAIKLSRVTKKIDKDKESNFITKFEAMVDKYGDNEAIVFEGTSWNYKELDARANAYAHWVKSQNIGSGQVIALLMENRPEYIACWIGILKSGATAALINNNLTGLPLSHSINISKADHVILGSELAENYSNITSQLEQHPTVWAQGAPLQGLNNLDEALSAQPQGRVTLDKKIAHEEDSLYIYTSGTTGPPKAARISHRRLLTAVMMFVKLTKTRSKDRNYLILPLYHSAGGMCAVGTSLLTGSTIILKRKFSVNDFWNDVHEHKITQFQYIGELCRYLTNAPKHPYESNHHIRMIIGNGLRPEVWAEFQPRFKIPKVLEFYAATEGNVTFVNFDGKVGSIGRIPFWARSKTNVEVVQFDIEAEEPVRGADGLCIKCGPDEVGEGIGQIFYDNPDLPSARFEGYVGEKETNKKILRNVFAEGDQWFRTGDLVKFDKEGYFYFMDRIGDTFRWKGENVATSEVAEVISVLEGVTEANIYGVQIPGTDGRAGMAAICAVNNLDLKKLQQHLCDNLPTYARPIFVRLQKEIEITSTFKHRKVELVKEGFDPEQIDDPIYFNDPSADGFVKLDSALYKKIIAGEIRL